MCATGRRWPKPWQGMDVVYHLAAAVGVGQSMYQIQYYTDVNTLGGAVLLDLLANTKHQVRKIIVASSMSIYGEGKYECADCGVVYPRLRTEAQLKARDWEMQCPHCGQDVHPVPTDEDKPLYPDLDLCHHQARPRRNVPEHRARLWHSGRRAALL